MSAKPPAATIGPIVMNSRGPLSVARRPKTGDSANMSTVTGKSDSPAAIAEYRATCCRNTVSRNVDAVSPA